MRPRAALASPAVRVLYVDHARALGGAEYSLLELLRNLPASVDPALATRDGALADEATAMGVPVFRVPMARLRSAAAPWLLARGAWGLDRVARRWAADVVHANVLRAALYASVAPVSRGRLLWHVRDIHEAGWTPRWLCRRATVVVANSTASAAALPCAAAARVVVNPVAAPTPADRTRADLGLPEHGAIVAHVARLRPWKGQADFLRIAAAIPQSGVHFLVIGGRVFADNEAPTYERELHALAADLGVSERVTFVGHRSDLADIWPHVDVMVHTSKAEPFGRTVAEAQAAGVSVVGYGDGGIPEIVTDGATGLLVPSGDIAGAAAAVGALLASPDRRRAYADSARAAGERFAPERHAQALVAIYRELAGQQTP